MKKIFRWLLILLGAAIVILQFIRPPQQSAAADPAVDFIALTHPPAEVEHALRVGCYDCHSNETRYPWYANVQPVGWWLSEHIHDAQGELNFSEWGSYRVRRKYRKLEEVMKQIDENKMPLPSYQIMHGDARYTPEQKKLLLDWIGGVHEAIKATTPADSLARPRPGS